MTNQTVAGIYSILIAVTLLTVIFAYVKDRNKPAVKYLISLCAISICWQMIEIMYYLVADEALALWLSDLKLIFVAFAPMQLLVLSVKFYKTKISRKTKLVFGLLCIVPAVTAVLAATAPYHNFLRTELYFVQFTPLRETFNVRGVWFWVHSVYSYIIMIASITVVLYQHTKLPAGFRTPSMLVIIGSTIALVSNILVILTPYSSTIDLTLIGLCAALLFIYVGISLSDASSLVMLAFDNIFSYIKDSIFILDDKQTIIEMNPTGRSWLKKLNIDEDISSFSNLLVKLASNNKEAVRVNDAGERDFYLMIDQQIFIYNLNEFPITDQSGKQIGTFAVFVDITRYLLIIQNLEESAGIDPLTALGNRRNYEEAIISMDVPSSYPLSVILGDVNGLKYVNDNKGHGAGDTLLRQVAQVLSDVCREGGRAYRIGGDEFVMLMPRTSKETTEGIVAEIREALADISKNSPYIVSIAIGFTTKETEEQSLSECIAKADSLMYLNKQNDRRARRD